MQRFASYALALLFLFAAVAAQAQTVRFTTSVGAFDMVLNPTGDANLQPLVDNMLANVAAGVYHDTWVNRADPGFVLQLGGFSVDSVDPDRIESSFEDVEAFEPITVDGNGDGAVDFAAQSNTPGTVSLALSAGNPNSGTSSFFINISDNTGSLDPQGFVPFAVVEDLTVVNQIMSAPRIDVGPQLGAGSGNIAFSNAPTANGDLIVIESVGVVSSEPFSYVDPLLSAVSTIEETAAATSQTDSEASINALTIEDDIPLSPTTDFGFFENAQASVVNSIPEPSSMALFLLAAAGLRWRR